MAEVQDIEWPALVERYLENHHVNRALVAFLERFGKAHPLDLTTALDPEHAAAQKTDTTGFLLFAIREAVIDHSLTDAEVKSLRQVARLLRIEEGDFLTSRKAEVADLLSEDMERLLVDQTIDPGEALHKVKLQELFGLGYDQFVSLTAPQVEKVILDLISQLDPSAGRNIGWLLERISALDTVYDFKSKEWGRV